MPATILVVEDHEAVRRALRYWLRVEFPQYQVMEATSGEEAVGLARARLPNLVIMDIHLPGMTGIEATRQIKAALPSVPVVMLTIHESDTFRTDAASAGASAYVSKRRIRSGLISTLAALMASDQE